MLYHNQPIGLLEHDEHDALQAIAAVSLACLYDPRTRSFRTFRS